MQLTQERRARRKLEPPGSAAQAVLKGGISMRSFGDRAALGFLSVLSSGAMLFLPWDRSSAQETLEQLERQIADRCRGKDPKFLIDARCREGSRFSAYEPNYAVWRRASGDENAIRVHYSFRHLLTEPDCVSAYRRE